MKIQGISPSYKNSFKLLNPLNNMRRLNFTQNLDVFEKRKQLTNCADIKKIQDCPHYSKETKEEIFLLNDSCIRYCAKITDLINSDKILMQINGETLLYNMLELAHNKDKKDFIPIFEQHDISAQDMVVFLSRADIERKNIKKVLSLIDMGIDNKNALFLATSEIENKSLVKYYNELMKINPKAKKNIGRILISTISYDEIKKGMSKGATTAYEIKSMSLMNEKKQDICTKLIKENNIPAYSAILIANLSEKRREKCLALINKGMGIGDAILKVSNLSNPTKERDKVEDNLTRIKALLLNKAGVLNPNYSDRSTTFPEDEGKFLLNDSIKNDINRLFSAYKNNGKIIDYFIPIYTNIKEGMKSTKNGDLFAIDKDTTYIKIDKKTYGVINLSREKCIELFPPVERYLVMQTSSGNCAFIAMYSALMASPDGKAFIYSLFSETPNGSVKVNIPNEKEYTFTEDMELSNDTIGCKGFQLFHSALNSEIATDMVQELIDTLEGNSENNKFFHKILDFIETIDENKTKQEIIDKIETLDINNEDKEELRKNVFRTNIEGRDYLNTEYIDNLRKYAYLALENEKVSSEEIISRVKKLQEEISEKELWENGFSAEMLYRMLYLTSESYSIDDLDNLGKLLSPENWKDHIYEINSDKRTDNNFEAWLYQIVNSHSYSVQPFINNAGEINFKLTNPWNTAVGTIVDLETIEDNFGSYSHIKIE